MENIDFIRELCVAATGMDGPANTAWLCARLADPIGPHDATQASATLRAAAHWQKADENTRDALAAALGISEPRGERWPCAKAIRADYEMALEYVYGLLAE